MSGNVALPVCKNMAQKAGYSCISTSALISLLMHVICSLSYVFPLRHISDFGLSLLLSAIVWLQEMKGWFDVAADGPGWPESKSVPGACRVAKFNGVHTLILHIPENFGADHTRITFIGIKGDFSEVGLQPVLFHVMTSGISSTATHLVCFWLSKPWHNMYKHGIS